VEGLRQIMLYVEDVVDRHIIQIKDTVHTVDLEKAQKLGCIDGVIKLKENGSSKYKWRIRR